MPKITRSDRLATAEKRLFNILGRHGIALMRTLEQKISDAGPYGQRIDPHLLTEARQALEEQGQITRVRHKNAEWYRLTDADATFVADRLKYQAPVHTAVTTQASNMRIGQALEIAVFRALRAQTHYHFFGSFLDLDDHGDDTLYSKEEPPSVSGKSPPGKKKFDFLAIHNQLVGGIEVKNIREWLYPNREEIRELLLKATATDAVPVLIARRIHFSSFVVLNPCGVIMHETYNQRYPQSASALADKARHKDCLGYHDIRTGNQPDERLRRFLHETLPAQLPDAQERFTQFHDLAGAYARGDMSYLEFAARVRRRSKGQDEDFDEE